MSTNGKDQPGDWMETCATDVHDGGIGVKDASRPIIEALNRGEAVKPEDLEEIQQAINELENGLYSLKEELGTLNNQKSNETR